MKERSDLSLNSSLLMLERRPLLLLGAAASIYAPLVSCLALRKLIWDDEFFTLYIATAPGWSGIWQALSTGADQHPPLFYWIHQQIISAFGAGHLSLRLPEILGGLMMIAALYAFTARRTSPLFGISAALLPLLTLISPYTFEARGYGLVVGWYAVALLCWQIAAERRSLPALAGLWLALFLTVSSHYYGLILLCPLAAGQLVQCVRRRELKLPVWFAFSGAVAPILLFFPLIRAARSYAGTFWAKAAWGMGIDYYSAAFGGAVPALISFAVLLASYRLVRGGWPVWGLEESESFKEHEVAAVVTLTLTPLMVLVLAKTVTIGFYPRYIIAGAMGISLLVIMAIHAGVRGNRAAGALLALALAVCFATKGILELRGARGTAGVVAQTARFLQVAPYTELPIVVSEITEFHRLSFYANAAVADRLVYLSDPADSLTYLGHDTVDKGFLALRPWFPLRLPALKDYATAHRSFLVYGYIGDWTWLTFALIREGFRLQLLGRNGIRLLLLATRPDGASGGGTDGSGRELEAQAQFPLRRMIAPADGNRSLCQRWIGDATCERFLTGPTYGRKDELLVTARSAASPPE